MQKKSTETSPTTVIYYKVESEFQQYSYNNPYNVSNCTDEEPPHLQRGQCGIEFRLHLYPKGICNMKLTDLYTIFYFPGIMLYGESRLHHSWKFNVRILFMLMLKFIQQCLICRLWKAELKTKERCCSEYNLFKKIKQIIITLPSNTFSKLGRIFTGIF